MIINDDNDRDLDSDLYRTSFWTYKNCYSLIYFGGTWGGVVVKALR